MSVAPNKQRGAWYEDFVPNPEQWSPEVGGSVRLIDGDLVVPPSLLEDNRQPSPIREMLPALDAAFNNEYWPAQAKRIESWGGAVVRNKQDLTLEEAEKVSRVVGRLPVLDKLDKQAAFEAELSYAKNIVDRVLSIYEKDPLATIVILHDLDESAGAIPEPYEGDEFLGQSGDADVDSFVIRPALAIVTEYLYSQKGIKIESGVLSTKEQRWLNKFFHKLPSEFNKDLSISSRDGRFAAQMGEEMRRAKRGGTMDEVYDPEIFPGYSAVRIAMNLNSEQINEGVSPYDLKPLMAARLQQEPRYAASTVVLVDDWGLMALFTNTHSDQQAVPLEKVGAKFATPDVAWERAYLEYDRISRVAENPIDRINAMQVLRDRYVVPNSDWDNKLKERQETAREEALVLGLLRPKSRKRRAS